LASYRSLNRFATLGADDVDEAELLLAGHVVGQRLEALRESRRTGAGGINGVVIHRSSGARTDHDLIHKLCHAAGPAAIQM
jgi:hypothetical protein